MENISNIINDYAELNKLYRAVSVSGRLLFEQQKGITAFWQSHNDTAAFEQRLLQTISERGLKQTDAIFLQLKETVAENSAIYTANKPLFISYDTVDICKAFADRFHDQIREQTVITTDAHKAVVVAENALDYASLDADNSELQTRLQVSKEKHAAEQRKLQMLHAMAEQAQQEVIGCSENLFEKINKLGVSHTTILDKYIIDKPTKQPKQTSATITDSSILFIEYFPMNLLAEIHAECVKRDADDCDGKQFEPIPVVAFYYAMNLGESQTRLIVAPDEKVRVCYLLRRMRDRLPAGQREQWLTEILDRLRINRATFTSKTAEVSKRYASRANIEFTAKTDAIFKRIG